MSSQPSTDLSSAMRLSISLRSSPSPSGPGSGSPMGPQRLLRNSNGSGGWLMRQGRRPSTLTPVTQELHHLRPARHGVLVAKIDERPAVALLEEQIAGQIRAVAVHRPYPPKEKSQRPRQFVHVPNDHALQGLARRNHEHFDLPQRQPGFPELFRGNEADGAIQSIQYLD